MTSKRAVALAVLTMIGAAACKDDPGSHAAPPTPVVVPVPPVASGTPDMTTASGTVAETMNAAGYTYLRLKTSTGDRWAAVTETTVAVGESVTIVNATAMQSFTSPTLKRTFDEILFGTIAGRPTAHGVAAAAAPPSVKGGPVAKAEGPTGHTVAEVFAGKATLRDKTVTVRGRVVKYNAGILGKNWVHLSDGTGTKAGGDDDLTFTTQGETGIGEVVLARGVVHLDRDFGSGYSYPLMIEDATLEKP